MALSIRALSRAALATPTTIVSKSAVQWATATYLRPSHRPLTTSSIRSQEEPAVSKSRAEKAAGRKPCEPPWLGNKIEKLAPYLRDVCPCPVCVSPSSGQKTFATPDIPSDLAVKSFQLSPESELTIEWENDIPNAAAQGHKSVYPATYLDGMFWRKPLNPELPEDFVRSRMVPEVSWNKELMEKNIRKIAYQDWMGSESALWQALFDLEAFGLTFITGVPKETSSVAELALRIGNLQETFYGRTWDVVSKPNAENVAYTNSFLGLHQDMLYLQQPPRIQLLHCLENSCEGGESIFSDGRQAALTILNLKNDDDVQLASALTKVPMRYHYQKHPFYYRNSWPIIDEPSNPPFHPIRVWWSPPFQAPNPPHIPTDTEFADHETWLAGMRRFSDLINAPENVYEYKMQPGECVVFDNRRVLHGRRAFDTGGGARHLRGTYISDEDFRSKMRGADGDAVLAYRKEKGVEEMTGEEVGEEQAHHDSLSVGRWLRTPPEGS